MESTTISRCEWSLGTQIYVDYHDLEWGTPVHDDVKLFEMIALDGMQAGLSWLTILKKRESFRAAFRGFDLEAVARFGARDVARLLGDAGIVRHRGKMESTINNARRARELADGRGSLAAYFWSFEPTPADRPKRLTWPVLLTLAKTPASTALGRDLKKRGWTFVGPTTAYAFMQAMGLVNDHVEGCAVRDRVERARSRFRRPR